jgi:hypothetical protein
VVLQQQQRRQWLWVSRPRSGSPSRVADTCIKNRVSVCGLSSVIAAQGAAAWADRTGVLLTGDAKSADAAAAAVPLFRRHKHSQRSR